MSYVPTTSSFQVASLFSLRFVMCLPYFLDEALPDLGYAIEPGLSQEALVVRK